MRRILNRILKNGSAVILVLLTLLGMAVAGALIIGSVRNVLDLLGVHPFFQNVLVGTIIILVVFGSGLSRYRRTGPV